MKKRFVVLGGYGIIGRAVVNDLFKFSKNAEIIIAGRDLKKASEHAKSFKSIRVKARKVDINNEKELVNLLRGSEVCVNCVQYYFNLIIMKTCLKARTNYVDLGGLFHYTKKQLKLHNEFKKIGRTAILGMGAAPGISNILAFYGSQFLEKINKIEIVFADKDYTNYKQKFILPYSFKTIIDEYTLKPSVFKNGKIIFVKAYSGVKEYDFPDEFGKQKGFLTLHSEVATLPDSLKHKGIQNCEFRVSFSDNFSWKIEKLIELGFTSKDKVNFDNKNIQVIDITSEIVDKLIPKNVKIKDKEIIRVYLKGKREIIMDALTLSDGGTSAGVLDTAIPCSIAAQMITNGKINEGGVFPPEKIIKPDIFFKELKRRGIAVFRNGEKAK